VPLYYGFDRHGSLWIASEMKALVEECPTLSIFPPGHAYTRDKGLFQYYKPSFYEPGFVPREPLDLTRLRKALEMAVVRRLMCDCPYGVLLSGGLDSSLIASIGMLLLLSLS